MVNLSALGGSIGATGAALTTTTGDLRLASGGSIVVANTTGLTNLALTANHADSRAADNTYSLSATGLTFQMTDGASDVTLGNIVSDGTTLAVTSDRGILVGTVNSGTADITLTANGGSITGTGGLARITGGALTLVARGTNGTNGGILAVGETALKTTVNSLTVASGSGGLMIANTGALTLANINSTSSSPSSITATGTITVGAVQMAPTSGSSTLTIATTGGSIVDDGNAATSIKANTLTLTASGAIGASGAAIVGDNAISVSASAGAGGIHVSTNTTSATTFQSVKAVGGNIVLSTLGAATLTAVDGTADVTVTSGGAIAYNDVKAGTTGDITLTAGGNGIAATGGGVVGFRGRKLTVSGTGMSSSHTLISAVSEIDATAGTSGNITVTQTGSVLLNTLVASGGQIAVTVTGAGAVTTAGTLTASSTLSITTPGALVAAGGNQLSASAITLNAGGAIGSSGNRLNTRTAGLTVTSTGSFFIDNTAKLLTALTIDNRHVGSVANTLSLTSQGLMFTVADNGTSTTLSQVSSPFLTTFSMTSDKSLVLGQLSLAATAATAAITSTNGSILDDGNALTRVSAKSITFSATENIGAAGQAIGLNTANFTVTTHGNLHIANAGHFNSLDITSKHATSNAVNTFTVTGQHLDLAITDHAANGYTITRLIDSGYDVGGGLNAVSFSGDRDITLGEINTGMFNYEQPSQHGPSTVVSNAVRFVTSNGSILDDGIDTTTVLASNVILGSTRSVGRADANAGIDVVAKALVVNTGTEAGLDRAGGGIYINALRTGGVGNEANALVLGYVNSGEGSGFQTQTGDVVLTLARGDIVMGGSSVIGTNLGTVTLQATTGSILNPGTSSVVTGTDKITLAAGKAIGGTGNNEAVRVSAIEIAATATQGGVTLLSSGGDASTGAFFSTVTAGGDIAISQSNRHLRVGAITANSGTGKVVLETTSTNQSIIDDGNGATHIVGGDVTLGAASGSTVGGGITITAPVLTVTGSSTIGIVNNQAFTNLTVNRSGSSGSVTIAGTGQSLTMSGAAVSTLTSATGLNFALNVTDTNTLSVGAVNVGAGGTFAASTAGAITWTGGSDGRIVADSVSLTAGSSYAIGTSAAPVRVTSGKLTLNAGRSMSVASDVALTHLDVTSTNSTSNAYTYSITGAGGPVVSIADDGARHTIDVSSGSLTDFSFTGHRNIAVSEIIATGAVKLTTSGGGENSNITSISPSGRITAASVTLAANGTGAGNGSIGSSDGHLQVSAASLDVTSNGDIRINNNSTTVTALKVTSTHKSAATTDNNTYSFTNLGGISFTVSDSAGVHALGLVGVGAIDFAYSVDRALRLSTIDAGTSTSGSIALTSTGGATDVAPTINRGSGTLTAGEITLSAVGTNGNVGGGLTLSTNTQKLTVASGGNISISNNGTLTDLSLDLQHKKSSSGSNSYSISSSGLSFSVSDVVDNGVTSVKLASIVQTGLNLTVKADRRIALNNVGVGGGKVTLVSTGNIAGNSSSSVVTAGTLDLTGQSITGSTSGSALVGTVGTLKVSATGSINYQNQTSLALAGVSNLSPNGSGATVAIKVVSGDLTQTGSVPLATNALTLTVENGSIGAGGAPLLINAQDVTLNTGRHVYLTNQNDFYKLGWTVTHSSVGVGNTYAIAADNLAATITDDGTTLALDTFDDASGLDFTFSTDTHLRLGTVSAQLGRAMALTATGTAKNIDSIAGVSAVTAGKLTLTASGNIALNAVDNTSRLQVNAHALNIVTGGDVFLDNLLDMQTLAITSEKATGGGAPTFSLSGQNITFSIVDSGTALINVTDTTGLAFTFDSVRGQKLGIIDLTVAGSATLTSDSAILGSTNSNDRLTAAMVTLSGMALGSSTDILRLNAPIMTFSGQGNIYVESALHIEKLKLTNSSMSSTADRTFSIVGADLAGNPGAATIQATHTNAGGTVFASITDTTGLDFEFVNDRITTLDSVNVGAAGVLSVSATPGIRKVAEGSKIAGGRVSLLSSSGAVGQSGGVLDVTAAELTVAANDGAYIDLRSKTKLAAFNVSGTSALTVSSGDLEIVGMALNGAALAIDVTAGSILGGGSIGGAGVLSLMASGAIGAAGSPLNISANSSGTTTLTAAAGNGGISLAESNSLTINSLSATSDVVVTVGSSSASRTLTLNGDVNAGTGAVSLTVNGDGSIESTTVGGKITGSSVTLAAAGGSIGAVTSPTTVVKTDTAKLILNSGGNIHINNGATDLTDLAINRATKDIGTSTSGTLAIAAQNLTFTVTDNGTASTLTNVTDTTGLNFSYKAKGDIAVGTVSVGAGSVDLRATASTTSADVTSAVVRSITGTTDSNKITAGALTLVAGSHVNSAIGSSSRSIGTNVPTLSLTSGGGATVRNDGALTLNSAAAGGALTVATADGALTLNGPITWASNGALTLSAGGSLLSNGVTLAPAGAAATITLLAGSGIGTESNALRITPASSGLSGTVISATVSGEGSLYLDLGATLLGGLTTSVADGATVVNGSGGIVVLGASSGTDASGNDISITTSSGNITLGTTGAAGLISAGQTAGKVVLQAGGGIRTAHADSAISAHEVTLRATDSIGTSTIGAAVGVSTTRLLASTVTTGHGVYLKANGTVGVPSITTHGGAISIAGSGATVLLQSLASNRGDALTGGAVSIEGSVVLAGGATVDAGSGDVTFAGTVNGPHSLTVNSTGATAFNAAVGGVNALTSLTTNVGGTVSLRSVTTTGAQTYGEAASLNGAYVTGGGAFSVGGPITLAGDTSVVTGAGGITLGSTVNGAYALDLSSSGAINLQGVVGNVAALTQLSAGTGGTLNLHSVTTTGAQTYGSAATLNSTFTTTNAAITFNANVTLAHDAVVSTGSGNVTFAGTVNGAHGLTVNSTGATAFQGTVGGTTALASLTTNAGGTLSLTGVTTTGAQSYGEAATISGVLGTTNAAISFGGPVLLGGTTTLNTGTGAVAFASTINGGHGLTVNAGQVTFGDSIGATTRLGALVINSAGQTEFTAAVQSASLTTDAAGTLALNGGSIDTTGAQTYGELVTLGGDTTLTGTLVSFTGGVGSAVAGMSGLTVTGNAAFADGAGAPQALRTLSVSGTTALAGTIVTTGVQTYTGAATLTGATVLNSGAAVSFLSTLDGGHGLTIGATQATFASSIGAATRLGALTVNSAGQTLFSGTVRAASVTTDAAGTLALNGGSVDTTGTQTYGERAVLGANTTLTGSLVTLQGGVDAATAGSQSLAVVGNAAFNNTVGGTAALSSLSVSGTSAFTHNVSTTGTQTFGGAATLGGAVSFVSTAGSLVFGGSIDAPGNTALSLMAGGSISVSGATGGTSPIGSLTINAGDTVTFTGGVTAASVRQEAAAGLTSFLGGVTASGTSGVHLTGGSYVFNGPVSATNGAFILENAPTATVAFAANAAIRAGTGFIQSGGASILLPSSVTVTLGPITLNAPATLHNGTATITTVGHITMTGLVGAATDLTMSSGAAGDLVIGLKNGSADEKIEVRRLLVPTAASATMFGSVAGRDGATAATVINTAYRGDPYFINDTPWNPPQSAVTVNVPQIMPVPVPVPSTPDASSLFTGTVTPSGITPNVLQAYMAPQVLTVGAQPQILTPSSSPPPLVPPPNAGPSFAPGETPAPVGSDVGGRSEPEQEI
ncbi:MAG: hypothetical protein WCZ23_05685 [Rhodospirillaceae bacterium]